MTTQNDGLALSPAQILNRVKSETVTKLARKNVAGILALIGAEDYRGRKFALVQQDTYTVNNGDLIWDGGSKTTVTFIRRNDAGQIEVVDALAALGSPVTEGGRTLRSQIPADVMIVEHSVFGGHDCGYRFIVASNSVHRITPPAAKMLTS